MNQSLEFARQVGRLQVFMPRGNVSTLLIDHNRCYRLGRGEEADLQIPDDSVSRLHLEIDTRVSPWSIRDLGSKNGTRINGRPLDRAELSDSCWLSLAGIPARLELAGAADAWREEEQTRQMTAQLLGRQLLESGDGFDSQLTRALTAYIELAECQSGALFLADELGQPELKTTIGADAFTGSNSVVRQVIEQGRAVVSSDVAAVQALADRNSIVAGGIRALVCMPLMLSGRPRGAMYAESRSPGKLFTDLDLQLLEGLASQAAFALALSRLRQDVARLREELPATPELLQSSPYWRDLVERVLPELRRA